MNIFRGQTLIGPTESQLERLEGALCDLEAHAETLGDCHDSLRRQVQSLEETVDKLQEWVSHIDARQGEVIERLSAVEERISLQTSEIIELEERFKSLSLE